MPEQKTVLFIGLDPDVVDYTRYPGLTAEKLLASLQADQARLGDLGYDVSICLVDRGATAAKVVVEQLGKTAYDCMMIGAGVRTDPEHFQLFEKLINLAHRHAPQASICFNTGPTDSAQAVRRWV